MPNRIAALRFDVADPQALAAFYVQQLGMTERACEDGVRVGYDGADADLVFCQSAEGVAYTHSREGRYWKIGITLPNVDMACELLTAAGVEVSQPRQFQEIGYMAHLSDPEGFQIELLQHTFEGQPRTSEGERDVPLGGGATVGQVTYRTADITAELSHYRDALGMSLLSRQPVEEYGFDLYFLAFTDEQPPDPDIAAVTNRPWLWQRPYTTLEFQSFAGGDPGRFGVDQNGVQGEMILE